MLFWSPTRRSINSADHVSVPFHPRMMLSSAVARRLSQSMGISPFSRLSQTSDSRLTVSMQ